jgi:hypothetical protein
MDSYEPILRIFVSDAQNTVTGHGGQPLQQLLHWGNPNKPWIGQQFPILGQGLAA